jgi:hypothetical protein
MIIYMKYFKCSLLCLSTINDAKRIRRMGKNTTNNSTALKMNKFGLFTSFFNYHCLHSIISHIPKINGIALMLFV